MPGEFKFQTYIDIDDFESDIFFGTLLRNLSQSSGSSNISCISIFQVDNDNDWNWFNLDLSINFVQEILKCESDLSVLRELGSYLANGESNTMFESDSNISFSWSFNKNAWTVLVIDQHSNMKNDTSNDTDSEI